MAKVNWRGKQVTQKVLQNVALALGEYGLRAEGYAKKELRHGHGVESGTLRRSIHTAEPGYDWGGDDVKPAANTPERGGKSAAGVVKSGQVTVALGSGVRYALAVHQGHHSFSGYHYLTNGVDKAKPELAAVLKKYEV